VQPNAKTTPQSLNLRLNLARQLLRETKKSVIDVALDVG
jgi:transcriptional regulator GlxA family with amidase domain